MHFRLLFLLKKRVKVISEGFGSSSEIIWSCSEIVGETLETLEVLGNLQKFSVIVRSLTTQ